MKRHYRVPTIVELGTFDSHPTSSMKRTTLTYLFLVASVFAGAGVAHAKDPPSAPGSTGPAAAAPGAPNDAKTPASPSRAVAPPEPEPAPADWLATHLSYVVVRAQMRSGLDPGARLCACGAPMANQTIVTALLVGLSLSLLTACPKKAEPTVEAGVVDAAVVVLVPPDTDAAVAQFEAGATAAPVVGARPTTGGTVASAVSSTVAEPAAPVASAPAPGECCCELPGQPLASLGQSECTKAKLGKCVRRSAAPRLHSSPSMARRTAAVT